LSNGSGDAVAGVGGPVVGKKKRRTYFYYTSARRRWVTHSNTAVASAKPTATHDHCGAHETDVLLNIIIIIIIIV
jgi:hypothetical protein